MPNTKLLIDIFKEVFPEYEEFPDGHRLVLLYSKIKEWLRSD